MVNKSPIFLTPIVPGSGCRLNESSFSLIVLLAIIHRIHFFKPTSFLMLPHLVTYRCRTNFNDSLSFIFCVPIETKVPFQKFHSPQDGLSMRHIWKCHEFRQFLTIFTRLTYAVETSHPEEFGFELFYQLGLLSSLPCWSQPDVRASDIERWSVCRQLHY